MTVCALTFRGGSRLDHLKCLIGGHLSQISAEHDIPSKCIATRLAQGIQTPDIAAWQRLPDSGQPSADLQPLNMMWTWVLKAAPAFYCLLFDFLNLRFLSRLLKVHRSSCCLLAGSSGRKNFQRLQERRRASHSAHGRLFQRAVWCRQVCAAAVQPEGVPKYVAA